MLNRARQFDDYRDLLKTERKLVTELRASLPDQAYPSGDLSESLIGALLDERRQVVSEAQAAGVTLGEFGMGNNMYYYRRRRFTGRSKSPPPRPMPGA